MNPSKMTKARCFEQFLSPEKIHSLHQTTEICKALIQKSGVHSVIAMNTAGFCYTDNGDTARCDGCSLEVSGWTLDMKPFNIHAQRSPECPCVLSVVPDKIIVAPATISLIPSSVDDVSFRHQRIESIQQNTHPNILVEMKKLKQIRGRTFSHWPHRTSPSSAQMIESGFFSCNVGDRVICLYCNLICQQWVPNTDDPWEVHKILSPQCPYIIAMVKYRQEASVSIINEYAPNDHSLASNSIDPFRSNEVLYTAACHTAYIEISQRRSSFATWPNENLPSVDDLVRAGFFYTGTETTVKCFYCNGSLQNWDANDNPTIEHVRWFPHCAYAKQLYDTELCQKIERSNRIQQECVELYYRKNISCLVRARLDLPITKSLVAEGFALWIIKSCYKKQLRLTHDDFVDDCDLRIACTILQKQIKYIHEKKENIIIPSVAINKIRERELAGISNNLSSNTDVEILTSSQDARSEMNVQDQNNESTTAF